MHGRRRWAGVGVASALGAFAACGGDGSGPDLVTLSFSNELHECGGSTILTVTQVLGPSGAAIGNIKPGRYVARGSFTLPAPGNHVIMLGFLGSYVTASGGNVGEDRDHVITGGQPTGSYEVVQEVIEWLSGQGHPIVDIFPGTVVGGSAADCVRVF
ncbi:MAG: hypothetical protein ACRD08_08230 [Acidimicrobiales bacterium]